MKSRDTGLNNRVISCPANLPFSHNTCVTDRQTTGRRHVVSKTH